MQYLSQDSQELHIFKQTKWQCFKCFIIVFYTEGYVNRSEI